MTGLNIQQSLAPLGRGAYQDSGRRIGCQEVKLLSVLCTKITSLFSLPSCPPNFCSSDCYPPQPSLIREGERSRSIRHIGCCKNFSNHCKKTYFRERQNGASQSHNLCNINEITTSNASHSPRNDIENLCKTQVVDGTATFPRNDIESLYKTQYGGCSGTLPLSRKESGKSTSRFTLHTSLKKHAAFTLAEGATHVVHFDDIRQDAFNLVKGNTHVAHFDNIRRAAFTLAEVLITLGIIGVVAAMTMPSLIANHREKQTVAQLKKVYSTLQQAYLMAIEKHGDPVNWDLTDTFTGIDDEGNNITDYTSAYTIFNYLAENMKSVDGGKANQYIHHEYDSYSLDGTFRNTISTNRDIPNIALADGTTISSGWIANGMMDIYVSLNKCMNKGKCTLGKDTFYFQIYFSPAKIVPEGSPTVTPTRFKEFCNIGISNKNNGRGCTAWVLQNENMDYLHCDDLDWNTKIRCK